MVDTTETQTISDSDTFDGLDVTLDTTLPTYATDQFEFTADITTNGLAPDINVALVIDSSGSTGNDSGSDVDGDGDNDTFFEAQIFAAKELFNELVAAGYDPESVEITLIDYDSDADTLGTFNLTQLTEFEAALDTMSVGGQTNYEDALSEVLTQWEATNSDGDPDNDVGPDDTNLVLFLSDGFPFPSGQDFSDEVDDLEDDFNAQITGIGLGENSSLTALNMLDNTGGAEQVTDLSQISDVINAPPPLPELLNVEVFVNGELLGTFTPGDGVLIETAFGYRIDCEAITGYDYIIGEDIEVEVKANFEGDGNVLTTGTVFIPMLICFAAGTRILTPVGLVAVEDMAVGDRVVTRDHSTQLVRWIGESILSADFLRLNPKLKPIRFAKDSLGPDRPVRDLRVSRQHRILLRDWRAEVMFGQPDGVFAPAFSLCNDSTIREESGEDGVTYYHIVFDQHEVVYAEGVETESFHASRQNVAALSDAQREELFAIFPQFEDAPDEEAAYASARSQLKGREAGLLAPDKA